MAVVIYYAFRQKHYILPPEKPGTGDADNADIHKNVVLHQQSRIIYIIKETVIR
jgi:hypothetical protein